MEADLKKINSVLLNGCQIIIHSEVHKVTLMDRLVISFWQYVKMVQDEFNVFLTV